MTDGRVLAMTGGVAEELRPAEPASGERRAAEPASTELLTVGVEEEFLLVDPDTGAAAPVVDEVMERVPAELGGQVEREFQTSQIEIASPPGLELSSLRHSLGVLRNGLADAAEAAGVRLLAVGTGPAPGPVPPVVDNPRFHEMVRRFRMLVDGPGNNGMHIHVGVPDPEVGVQVLNHIRPWLPILHAATTNSPFYGGEDTGYASWRSMLWEHWPAVAPTPFLESHAHYERLLDQLIATGMMLDEGMLYWYARLSANWPTVEIRIGDVCPTLDDTVLVAALVRALVGTVIRDVAAGREAPRVDHHLLMAAHWRAAHDGLEGTAVDPADGSLVPAWHLMRRFFDWVRPELERHGDVAEVTALMERLHGHGTGAARQRAVYARRGELADVVAELARMTRGDAPGEGRRP